MLTSICTNSFQKCNGPIERYIEQCIQKSCSLSYKLILNSHPHTSSPLSPSLPPFQPSAALTRDNRLAQQQLYGIHFSDDYDYLQHLKEPGMALMEPAMPLNKTVRVRESVEKILCGDPEARSL